MRENVLERRNELECKMLETKKGKGERKDSVRSLTCQISTAPFSSPSEFFCHRSTSFIRWQSLPHRVRIASSAVLFVRPPRPFPLQTLWCRAQPFKAGLSRPCRSRCMLAYNLMLMPSKRLDIIFTCTVLSLGLRQGLWFHKLIIFLRVGLKKNWKLP